MNKTYISQVEVEEVYKIKIPEEFGYTEGQKFSIEETDGGILLKPFAEIEIDIDNELFLRLATMAHERDVTFNQLCNDILTEVIVEKDFTKL